MRHEIADLGPQRDQLSTPELGVHLCLGVRQRLFVVQPVHRRKYRNGTGASRRFSARQK
jgi:hypothetical protein